MPARLALAQGHFAFVFLVHLIRIVERQLATIPRAFADAGTMSRMRVVRWGPAVLRAGFAAGGPSVTLEMQSGLVCAVDSAFGETVRSVDGIRPSVH